MVIISTSEFQPLGPLGKEIIKPDTALPIVNIQSSSAKIYSEQRIES